MKPFTVIAAEQRSPEWKQARCGRLTASRAKDMLATIKTGEAAARRDLRVQLVTERLTGEPQDDVFINADMERGMALEADAFAAYEALTGQVATRCGFVAHNEIAVGCSPDGVLDDFRGIVELKCPRSANHVRYLRAGVLPAEHVAQITHALWVTGADYCDFLSFDPRFPTELQTFYVRVTRQAVDIDGYAVKALTFLAEVEAELQAVRTMSNPSAVLRQVAGVA